MVKEPEGTVVPTKPRKRRGALAVVGLLFRRVAQVLVLAVLVMVALAVGWVRSPDFQVRAIRVVETMLESATGERASLSRVRVQFWRPAIHAEGFALTSAQTGDPIVQAERITIPIELRISRLGLGSLGIGRLQLYRPEIHLHLDEKGKLREFANLKRGGRPLRELPWSSLQVVDGSLLLEQVDAAGQVRARVSIDDLEVSPTSGALADLSGRLQVQFKELTDETTFSWSDVQIGPDAIVLPSFALDLDTLDLGGRANLPLSGALDAELTARLELDKLQPLLVPPRAAHGIVEATFSLQGTPEDPTLHAKISGQKLGADVTGVFTPLLTYDLGEIEASAIARKDGIVIEELLLPWAGGRIVGTGRITPDKRLEDGHVTLEGVSFAPLLQAFDAAPTPWVNFVGDGAIHWSGTLDPLRLEGSFELGVAELHVGDRPIARPDVELMLDIPEASAEGSILLEKTHVLLDAPTVRGPRSRGSLVVDIGFGPRGPLDLNFNLSKADLEDFQPLADVELKGKGAISGRIAGPFNKLTFQGQGDVRDFSVLGIEYADRLVAKLHSPDMKSIFLEDARAELGSSSYHGRYSIDFKSPISMSTAIEIDRGRVEDMVGMFVDLDGLKGDLVGTLTLDGPLFDMSGEQHMKLSNVEIYGEKFPVGEGHGYMDKGLFTLDDLRVRRDGGQAGLTLRGSVGREWKLNMELLADGFELSKLDRLAPESTGGVGLPLTGKLGAYARITNTLFDPSPDGRIWLRDVEYAGVPAADSVLLVDSEDGIAHFEGPLLGGTAKVDGTLGLWGEQPYSLTAKLDKLPAHLFYPIAADGTPITAVVSGEVNISGDFGEVWSPVALDARLDTVEARYSNHVLHNTGPWTYRQYGDRFSLEGFTLKSNGSTDVRLSASRDESLLLMGDGTVDLDLLRAVVPGLEKSTGVAKVAFTAAGQRPNVEAVVDIEVSSQLFRHESAPLSFEDTKARIQVRRDRIDVLSVKGNLGGGSFTGSGTIDAVNWKPVRYDLAMNVTDAMVQWVDSLPPAIGNGSFRFDGPVDALLLSGDVTVTDMTFADRIDWEDWVVEYRDWMLVDPALVTDEPPMFNLNVHLNADKTIWLRNNVAEGTASADLRIIGDTVRPGLVGAVHIEDGLAFLQDRQFHIDRGELLFNDPWTWDPQLDLSLLTDITSRDQRYRVEYQVFGPFSNWRTDTRSDPFLPQADVNALLWFGMTTDELEEMGELQSAVVQGVADLLVTDFLVSGQAGDIGEELPNFLFDRIDLATGVNARGEYSPEPRLVVEKRLPTEMWALDLKWEFNPLRPNDNYVTASKRIGGIWSLAGWYASLQRDRALPIGGAYGVDVLARWEIE